MQIILLIIAIIVAFIVGTLTHFWLWGVLSFLLILLIMKWIGTALFGRPDSNELRRIPNRPDEEDSPKEELSLEAQQNASKFGRTLPPNKQPDLVAARQNNWSQEKINFYETPFNLDFEMSKKVNQVIKDHYHEIDKHWNSVDNQRREELIKVFYDNLAKEWPVEYSEIFITVNMQVGTSCVLWGQRAYLTGFAAGKGWISMDELTNENWFFAEFLLEDMKKIRSTAKSKSTALAVALMEVSKQGTIAASPKKGTTAASSKQSTAAASRKKGTAAASTNKDTAATSYERVTKSCEYCKYGRDFISCQQGITGKHVEFNTVGPSPLKYYLHNSSQMFCFEPSA